jgi:hypothetical protein
MATGQTIVWGGSPTGRVTIPALFKPQFPRVTTGTNHSTRARIGQSVTSKDADDLVGEC